MVGKAMGDEGRPRAHARSSGRGLAAGMAAADHDDVEALDVERVWSGACAIARVCSDGRGRGQSIPDDSRETGAGFT